METARVLSGLRGLASAKHSPPPSEHYNEPEGNLFGRIVSRAFESQLSTTLIWQSDHAAATREASITHPTGQSASTSSFTWAVWPSLPSSTNTSPTQSKTSIPISSSKPKFYSTARLPGPGARHSGGWKSAASIWNRTDTSCQRSTSRTIISTAPSLPIFTFSLGTGGQSALINDRLEAHYLFAIAPAAACRRNVECAHNAAVKVIPAQGRVSHLLNAHGPRGRGGKGEAGLCSIGEFDPLPEALISRSPRSKGEASKYVAHRRSGGRSSSHCRDDRLSRPRACGLSSQSWDEC